MTVEAARMTMMARRSAHDELRREGEARKARAQQVTKDLSGWRHRLETAETRGRRTGGPQGRRRGRAGAGRARSPRSWPKSATS